MNRPTHGTITVLLEYRPPWKGELARITYGIYRVQLSWRRGEWSADLNAPSTIHVTTITQPEPAASYRAMAAPYATADAPAIQGANQ